MADIVDTPCITFRPYWIWKQHRQFYNHTMYPHRVSVLSADKAFIDFKVDVTQAYRVESYQWTLSLIFDRVCNTHVQLWIIHDMSTDDFCYRYMLELRHILAKHSLLHTNICSVITSLSLKRRWYLCKNIFFQSSLMTATITFYFCRQIYYWNNLKSTKVLNLTMEFFIASNIIVRDPTK